MKMETNKEVAGREPPAAGLAACPYRSTDVVYRSHIDTKKGNAAANDTPSIAKDCKVPLAGLLPNGSALPVVKIVALLHNQELQ